MGFPCAVAIGAVVGLLFTAAGVLIAVTRWFTPAMRMKPRHVFTFATNIRWDDAMRVLLEAVPAAGYAIEEVDIRSGYMMLGQRISWWTWGFLLPVYFSVAPDGMTMVDVGIRSKLFQYGPIVRHNHRRCFEAVRAALGGSAAAASRR
jgi:hypothetical protein